jgi:hypothetical protein
MKQRRAGVNARKVSSVLLVAGSLALVGCESPTRPLPRLPTNAALLQSQAAATMRRVADVAGVRVGELQGLSPAQLNRRISQAVNRLPAKDRDSKLAFFGAESFDAFEREVFVLLQYAGKHYGLLMSQVQREQAGVIKALLEVEPGWETAFECEVVDGVSINAGCEGDGWEGDSDSPYCLKEAAAYTGAYVATLAAVKAYTQRPSDQTFNAVLFTTAAWFYAADVLSACIDREYH